MHRIIKKIAALALCAAMLLSVLPAVNARQCRTQNYASGYELTGFGPDDMIAIAMAQLGKTGTQMGYSEEWCADFVSDCAILAGQTDAIPAYAYCYGLYSAILDAGGKKTTSDPKPGDICFINWDGGSRFQHVEIVYKVEDGMVYTIGGNSGGGSNLYVRKVFLHDPLSWNVIVSIIRPNYQVLDISYASKCTSYDTYCKVSVTADTQLMSLPCYTDTDEESVAVKTLKAGKEVKALAVLENTLGQLWYKVKNGDGYAYLRATHTAFVSGYADTITVSDLTAPETLEQGSSFSLRGKVSAKGIALSTVTGEILKGDKVVMDATAKPASSTCQLRSSAVNQDMKFSSLEAGNYTFVLTASVKGRYANGDSLESFTEEAELYRGEFTVKGHECQFEFAYYEDAHPHAAVNKCSGCGKTKRDKDKTTMADDCGECYPEPEPTSPVPYPEENDLLPEILCFHPFFVFCGDCRGEVTE